MAPATPPVDQPGNAAHQFPTIKFVQKADEDLDLSLPVSGLDEVKERKKLLELLAIAKLRVHDLHHKVQTKAQAQGKPVDWAPELEDVSESVLGMIGLKKPATSRARTLSPVSPGSTLTNATQESGSETPGTSVSSPWSPDKAARGQPVEIQTLEDLQETAVSPKLEDWCQACGPHSAPTPLSAREPYSRDTRVSYPLLPSGMSSLGSRSVQHQAVMPSWSFRTVVPPASPRVMVHRVVVPAVAPPTFRPVSPTLTSRPPVPMVHATSFSARVPPGTPLNMAGITLSKTLSAPGLPMTLREISPPVRRPSPTRPFLEVLDQGRRVALAHVYTYHAPFSPVVRYIAGEEHFVIPAGWAGMRTRSGLLLWFELVEDEGLAAALPKLVVGQSDLSMALSRPNGTRAGEVLLTKQHPCHLGTLQTLRCDNTMVISPKGSFGPGARVALSLGAAATPRVESFMGTEQAVDNLLKVWLSSWEPEALGNR